MILPTIACFSSSFSPHVHQFSFQFLAEMPLPPYLNFYCYPHLQEEPIAPYLCLLKPLAILSLLSCCIILKSAFDLLLGYQCFEDSENDSFVCLHTLVHQTGFCDMCEESWVLLLHLPIVLCLVCLPSSCDSKLITTMKMPLFTLPEYINLSVEFPSWIFIQPSVSFHLKFPISQVTENQDLQITTE